MIEITGIGYPWITSISFPRIRTYSIPIGAYLDIPCHLGITRPLSSEENLHWDVELSRRRTMFWSTIQGQSAQQITCSEFY